MIEIKNRKASYEFEFLDKEIAGICLTGSEVKSMREGKANLVDAFVFIDEKGEAWLKKMYIAPYENGGYANHEPYRSRKMLLTKQQIKKWAEETKVRGITIIPYKVFFNNKGICKVELALAKGKKLWDKKMTIKERELDKRISNYTTDEP